MNEYSAVFRELRYEVWKVSFLNAFLNAAIAFFVSNIICTLFVVSYLYSLIPAAALFIWSFVRKARQYTLRRIEEGNPEVSEILRTAHDNSGGDTLMVHALFLDLLQKMETVSTGVFISPQRTVAKLGAIAILAFVPLLMTNYASFLIYDNPLRDVQLPHILPGQQLAPTAPIEDEGGRDIYGDKDIVRLGNEKLDITASSSAGGVDFTKPEQAGGNSFRYNDYPIDVQAEQTTAGTGGSADEADLINKYSECQRGGTCG